MTKQHQITKYLYVDETTGEIELRATVDINIERHNITISPKNGIRQKTAEPFKRVNTYMSQIELSYDERAIFYMLVEWIGWENNFVQKDNCLLSTSAIAEILKKDRRFIAQHLRSLQEKNLLEIVKFGVANYIYLYSKYVWYGFEKNRSDSKLKEFKEKFG